MWHRSTVAPLIPVQTGIQRTVFYGFSIFHCMTQSLASGGPGLGTCMGPAQTEALLKEAGFATVERLDIKSQTNLFYAARM